MENENDIAGVGCIFTISVFAIVYIFELTLWQTIIAIALAFGLLCLICEAYSPAPQSESISNSLRMFFIYSPTILLLELCAEAYYIILRNNITLLELLISTYVLSFSISLLFLFCISWNLSLSRKANSSFVLGTVSAVIISLTTSYVVPSYFYITNDNLSSKCFHIDKALTNITPSYWGKTYYVNNSNKTLYIYKTTCTYYKDKYNDNLTDIPFLQNVQLDKDVYFPEDFHLYEVPPRELSNQRIHYYVIDEDTYRTIQKGGNSKIVECNHSHKYFSTHTISHHRINEYHED